MFGFLLFVICVTLTPIFIIGFIDDLALGKRSNKNGIVSIVLFAATSLFLRAGTQLGADALMIFGWLYAVFCGKRANIRKSKIMKITALIVAIAAHFFICSWFVSVHHGYINTGELVILGALVFAGLCIYEFFGIKLYAKNVVFKHFCRMLIFVMFFLLGFFGTVAFLSDGLEKVMSFYKLEIHSKLLGAWWVMPLTFCAAASFMLVSENLFVFSKKLLGYLMALIMILMIVGEVVKLAASTNVVMMVNALGGLSAEEGYDESIITVIFVIGSLLRVSGTVFFVGIVAAFVMSLIRGLRMKVTEKRKDNDLTPVISVEQMRESDAYTIENFVSGKELMKRAAKGIFDSVDWNGKKVAVVCGSGNNGGDGYALSCILAEYGNMPTVFRVSEKFSEDGYYFFEQAKKLGIRDLMFEEKNGFEKFDIIVDCIFGTGFKGVPSGISAQAIRKINESDAFVVSADINSGMNGDTGEAQLAVKSDLTVSIGYYKTGLFQGRAPELIGELKNVDIGIVLV